MAEAMERDLYVGGDSYIDSYGNIDATIAANPNANIRQIRGIQANIREGDGSARGIPGDFVGWNSAKADVKLGKIGKRWNANTEEKWRLKNPAFRNA